MQPESSEFSLDELLARAAEQLGEPISQRTVRLYATKGLIDQPGRQGRSAVYSHRHLLQLLLLRTLARRGLSLSAIAPLVAASDEDLILQMRRLDDGITPDQNDASRNEALDYLEQLRPSKQKTGTSDDSLLDVLGTPLQSSTGATANSSSLRSSGRGRSGFRSWKRITLAPGVELHVEDNTSIPPRGSRRQAWLQSLLNRLHDQLDNVD